MNPANRLGSQQTDCSSLKNTVTCALRNYQRQTAQQHIDAVAECDKQDYRKASADLIANESDPARFLLRSDGNAEQAARKLVSYWTNRCILFGKRAAFAPMQIDKALTLEDCKAMRSGYVQMLPKDSRGRHALFLDSLDQEADERLKLSTLRCLYYLLSVAVAEDTPVTMIRYSSTPLWNRSRVDLVTNLVRSVPVQLDEIKWVFRVSPTHRAI